MFPARKPHGQELFLLRYFVIVGGKDGAGRDGSRFLRRPAEYSGRLAAPSIRDLISSHENIVNNKQYPGGNAMAKPIDIGLVLEGEDARAFQKYLEHPTFTREGLNLIREAKHDAEHGKLD